MSGFSNKLATFCQDFNQGLSSLFPQPEGAEKKVVEAMFYSLKNGGKRLRPFLVSASAALFDISAEKSFVTAAALECLHTYSLIHDDLPAMDNDDLRRGKPTCHKQFDEATAILAGDGLLTYAFELICGPQNPFSDEIKTQLCFKLSRAAGAFDGMVAGQMLDLYSETATDVAEPEVLINRIEEMKTGRLLCFACEAGAILGNASVQERLALLEYGRKIGTAFQIVDDILDVEGNPELMGKTLGKDAAQNKLTFVSVYGLSFAKEYAQKLIKEAITSLEIFGNKAQTLKQLAEFILQRQS